MRSLALGGPVALTLSLLLACAGQSSPEPLHNATGSHTPTDAPPPVGSERWIEEHEDDVLRRSGREIYSEDGAWVPDGPWVESETLEDFYSVFGIERQEGNYASGHRTGTWKAYDEDGALSWQGDYQGGEREGIWTWFHSNGQPLKRGLFRGGLEEGPWEWWHEDGSLDRTGRFEAGLDQGPWTFWHPNGELAREGLYEDGAATGEWKLYHPNGKLSEIGHFVPEPEIEGMIKLHDTGIRSSLRHGTWRRWDENGVALESIEYDMGLVRDER